jgi:hypothetical protein
MAAGGTRASEDRHRILALPITDVGRQLCERGLGQRDAIGRGDRAGVSRAQQPGQLVASLVQKRCRGWKPKRPLQCGVDW